MRSGMAGSTALVVALLQAFLAWQGQSVNRYQLAERARYIELNNLKVVCGYQDACMCTFGGLNYLDFRGKQFYRQAEAELFATIEPLADLCSGTALYVGVHRRAARFQRCAQAASGALARGRDRCRGRIQTHHRDRTHGQEGSTPGRLAPVGTTDEREPRHPARPGRIWRSPTSVSFGLPSTRGRWAPSWPVPATAARSLPSGHGRTQHRLRRPWSRPAHRRSIGRRSLPGR